MGFIDAYNSISMCLETDLIIWLGISSRCGSACHEFNPQWGGTNIYNSEFLCTLYSILLYLWQLYLVKSKLR